MDHRTLLYGTKLGAIYQDDRGRGFWLEWQGHTSYLTYANFQEVCRQVSQIDLKLMVFDPSPQADFAICSPSGCDRCFVLTLCQAWALKELIGGAQAMIELRRIVNDRLYSYILV